MININIAGIQVLINEHDPHFPRLWHSACFGWAAIPELAKYEAWISDRDQIFSVLQLAYLYHVGARAFDLHASDREIILTLEQYVPDLFLNVKGPSTAYGQPWIIKPNLKYLQMCQFAGLTTLGQLRLLAQSKVVTETCPSIDNSHTIWRR